MTQDTHFQPTAAHAASEHDDDHDALGSARGIMLGLCLAGFLWCVVIVAALALWLLS